jgi:hypothetical protein
MRTIDAHLDGPRFAGATFEIAAAEMAIRLHVADHGLDGGAAPELAFDAAEDAALLPRDEDAMWVWGFVAAVSLVRGSSPQNLANPKSPAQQSRLLVNGLAVVHGRRPSDRLLRDDQGCPHALMIVPALIADQQIVARLQIQA